MAIEINDKTISIGIRDLVMLEDNFSGYSGEGGMGFNRAELGRLAHESYQRLRERNENFTKEFHIKHQMVVEGYSILLSGRIDGLYRDRNKAIVEEVKSVFMTPAEFRNIDASNFKDYSNQLKVYCYIFSIQNPKLAINGNLVFINLIDSTKRRLRIFFDLHEIEEFIVARVRGVIAHIEHQANRNKLKRKWSEAIKFPFDRKRPYQDDIIDSIRRNISQNKNMLIHAPTGIGKTSAALFPVLKSGFENCRKIFFLTAKTTQQHLVLATLENIESQGTPLLAVALRAKRKMCLNKCFLCHENYCPYVNNFYRKLHRSGIVDKLLNEHVITPETIIKAGKEFEVCPFELSLELIFYADVVVCDYNYIFDPVVSLQRFFLMNDRKNCMIIIDEAHNLYERGRGYYSQLLSQAELEGLLKHLKRKRAQIYRSLSGFYRKLLSAISTIPKKMGIDPVTTETKLNKEYFLTKRSELQRLMLKYFIFKKRHEIFIPDDPLEEFYFNFNRFCIALALEGEEFTNIIEFENGTCKLKIVCMEPANQLRKTIERFAFALGMSGTLEPLEWYRDVLGFEPATTALVKFGSPFPVENRCIMAVPTISTRYRDRDRNYQQIADNIAEVVSVQRGNYIVFFPSFVFLEQVRRLLPAIGYKVISQHRTMEEYEREYVLNLLQNGNNRHLILAVQGGIFAEGVDYPGEMVIGVIIVGPGLPQVGLERELMKQYYSRKYGKGFEYAYLYPGMVRVIQSAGRVIRSENDRGIIVLLGSRFANRQYNSLFPKHWFSKHPRELLSTDFGRLKEFWGGFGNR